MNVCMCVTRWQWIDSGPVWVCVRIDIVEQCKREGERITYVDNDDNDSYICACVLGTRQ